MTSEHDVQVHERLASIETQMRSHASHVEGSLVKIVERLDVSNGRVTRSEQEIDLLQVALDHTERWKDSRDNRIGDLQQWRLDESLAQAHARGRVEGRRDLRKSDIAKLAAVVGAAQAAFGLIAWGAGLL